MPTLRVVRRRGEWFATSDVTLSVGRGETVEAAIDDLWRSSDGMKPYERPSSFLIALAELGRPDPSSEPWPRIAAGQPEPFLAPEYQSPHK